MVPLVGRVVEQVQVELLVLEQRVKDLLAVHRLAMARVVVVGRVRLAAHNPQLVALTRAAKVAMALRRSLDQASTWVAAAAAAVGRSPVTPLAGKLDLEAVAKEQRRTISTARLVPPTQVAVVAAAGSGVRPKAKARRAEVASSSSGTRSEG